MRNVKIIGLFQKNSFYGEYESLEYVKSGQDKYIVVLTDKKFGVKGLFKANLGTDSIEFRDYVLSIVDIE